MKTFETDFAKRMRLRDQKKYWRAAFWSVVAFTVLGLLLQGCAEEIAREEMGRHEDVESVSCTIPGCSRIVCLPTVDGDGDVSVSCDTESCPGNRDAKHLHLIYQVWYDDETKGIKYETQTLAYLTECK